MTFETLLKEYNSTNAALGKAIQGQGLSNDARLIALALSHVANQIFECVRILHTIHGTQKGAQQ